MDLGHQDNLCKVSKRSIALLEDIVDTQTEWETNNLTEQPDWS